LGRRQRRSTDVAVVGGGITGTASAYYLAKAGLQVTLFEREPFVGSCASGVNAGTLAPQNNPAPLMTLAMASLETWRGLAGELGRDVGYTRVGGFKIAETQEQRGRLLKYLKERTALGLPLRFLEGRELHDMAPYLSDAVVAANYCELDGYGDSLVAAKAFAEAARLRGVDVATATPVRNLERDDRGGYVLTTAAGSLRAGKVLLAAGLWTKGLAETVGVHLPISVRINQMAVTERMPSFITHVVSHCDRTLTVKQKECGSVLIGGGWPGTGQPTSPRALPTYESTIGNVRQALRVLPRLRHASVIRSWAGFDGRNPAQTPFLGAVPARPGLYVATSCSGGFTIGPIVGRLMAELVATGRCSLDISAFALE